MIWLIIIAVIAVGWYFIKSTADTSNSKAPPTPPSEDVIVIGCDPVCGYFEHKFKHLSNGDYDFVRRNGKLVAYCKYQGRDVCQGDFCPFAKDHPDKLTKGVFTEDWE